MELLDILHFVVVLAQLFVQIQQMKCQIMGSLGKTTIQ